jgi:hypothetical protein
MSIERSSLARLRAVDGGIVMRVLTFEGASSAADYEEVVDKRVSPLSDLDVQCSKRRLVAGAARW